MGTPWPGVEAVAGALPSAPVPGLVELCVIPAESGAFASSAMIAGSSLAAAEEKRERWVCPEGFGWTTSLLLSL